MQEYPLIDQEEMIQPPSSGRKKTVLAVVAVLLVVVLAVVSALLVKQYVISSFIVDGISMYPTLDGGNGAQSDSNPTNGEVLFLNRLAKIERGDIVVFTPNWGLNNDEGEAKTLVKRVIAVGGDHIRMEQNKVYLNGELLKEDYINSDAYYGDNAIEYDIPDGYVFGMGDNRNHSTDCRIYGPVSLDTVIGKCFLIKGIDGKLRKP